MITFQRKATCRGLCRARPRKTASSAFAKRLRKGTANRTPTARRARAKQTAEDNPYSVNSPAPRSSNPANCYCLSLSRREVNFVNAVSSASVSHQRLSSTDMAMLDRVLKEVARRTHWRTRASMRNLWPSCCCGSFTRE